MNNQKNPIAVFDSGLGGISVLRELVKLMPNENYIYYGDFGNAPYGIKSADKIMEFVSANVDNLINTGAKAVVIACNTATAVSAEHLRKKYKNVPIVGVEPALKPAVMYKKNSKIIVIATNITLSEEKFKKLMNNYKDMAEIITVPCPGIVEFVEKGIFESPELENYLVNLFKPYKNANIDSIVLGCTHYPFVKNQIRKIAGNGIMLFDGGEGTARETHRKLCESGLLNAQNNKGYVKITGNTTSDYPINLAKKLLYSEN